MSAKRPPKDANELAKYILDVTTGEAEKIEQPKKDSAAVELGRRGGLKSAQTRNQRLSPTKRKAIAKKAAKARWGNRRRTAKTGHD
jgi:hypothetical protein